MTRSIARPRGWLLLSAALLVVPAAVLAQGRESGALLGRVTEAGTGRPIGGATVTAGAGETSGGRQTLTASDGIFFLTPLLPGRHTITATYGGYETASLADYSVRPASPSEPAPRPVLLSLRRVGQTGGTGHEPTGRQRPARPNLHLEARVRWETKGNIVHPDGPAPRPAVEADRFVVVEIHRFAGARPRQRTPELSEEQILIVGTDARGRPRDWSLVPDPATLREEGPGPDGRLTGKTHRLAETEFLVTMPADPEIAELRFYHPRWTGTLFSLDLLGAARFPARPALSGARSGSLTPGPDR